jgi:hypothetical protein
MEFISYDTMFLMFASTVKVECDNKTGSVFSAYCSVLDVKVVCIANGVGFGSGPFPTVDSFSHYFDAIAFACGVIERFRTGRDTDLVNAIDTIEKLRPEIFASHAIEELFEKYLSREYIQMRYIECACRSKRIWKQNRNNIVHLGFTNVPNKDDHGNMQKVYNLTVEVQKGC